LSTVHYYDATRNAGTQPDHQPTPRFLPNGEAQPCGDLKRLRCVPIKESTANSFTFGLSVPSLNDTGCTIHFWSPAPQHVEDDDAGHVQRPRTMFSTRPGRKMQVSHIVEQT
jgi:hypothetical protein